ncbi:RES domain-containing protein [Leptospira interrogans]
MTPNSLLISLNALEADALGGVTTEKLLRRFSALSKGFSLGVAKVSVRHAFRARRNLAQRPFENVSELWYPPAEHVNRGRLNEERSPLFYASDSHQAAIWELKPNRGDVITVLEVRLKKASHHVQAIVIGDLSHINRARKPILQKGTFIPPDAFRKRIGIEKYEKSVVIDRKIAGWFASDSDYLYPLTIAISRSFFAIPGVTGIVYPSVAWGGFFNLAMLPTAADQHMEAVRAFSIAIDNPHAMIGQSGGVWTSRSSSISADGTIQWEANVK